MASTWVNPTSAATSATNLGLGTGSTPTLAGLNVTSATATGSNTLISTDSDAAEGPLLDLYRNSTTPANADSLGGVRFQGNSSTGVKRTYAEMSVAINDTTNTSEDATLNYYTMKAGTLTAGFNLNGFGIGSGGTGVATTTQPIQVTKNANAGVYIDVDNPNASSSAVVGFSAHSDGTDINFQCNSSTNVTTFPATAYGATLSVSGNSASTLTLNGQSHVYTAVSGTFVQDITYSAGAVNRTLSTIDAGSSGAQLVDEMYRDSASPANADVLSRRNYTGNSSNGTKRIYGLHQCRIVDKTDASEDASFDMYTMSGGNNSKLIATIGYDGFHAVGQFNTAAPAIAAGFIGEVIESVIARVSAVSITSQQNITSISLTAGVWMVAGVVAFRLNDATGYNYLQGGISTTTANIGTVGDNAVNITNPTADTSIHYDTTGTIAGANYVLGTTTTIYLVGEAGYGGGTYLAYGRITAQRIA